MYYFLKNKDFNLEEYDFNVKCYPRLTIKEHELLDILLSSYSFSDKFSEIEIAKLKYSYQDLHKMIANINRKSIFCQIFKNNIIISEFYFNIFNIAVFEQNKIIYKFSKEISLTEERGNFYSRINILAFLRFKLSYTQYIFKVILKVNKRQASIDYSLEDFKDLLHISKDKYTRYYDLEQKILNPIIRDMELTNNIVVFFDKIKNNNKKTSRIIGIRLNFIDVYHSEIHNSTNSILKKFAERINDFSKAYEIIYDYRKIHTEEETISYIEEKIKKLNL